MEARELLAAGSGALARGEWGAARDGFRAAWSVVESADALDGMALASWWLDDPETALHLRARACARLRHEGRDAEAAAVALWLARQHRSLSTNSRLADGWLSRARTLVAGLPDTGSLGGWLAEAESEAARIPSHGIDAAERALVIAREHRDTDLEIMALARRGACRVGCGDMEAGMSDLYEAMTAATSGEGNDVQYVGEALCTLLEVASLLGAPALVKPWASFLVDYRARYAFGPLLPLDAASAPDLISAFCTGCCGGVYLVTGRLDAAEEELIRAAARLASSGLRPRCLHPVAELVDLRVLQGRLREAEALLAGFDEDVECAAPAAMLDLALGRPSSAVGRLVRALDLLGETPLHTLPVHVRLVDAGLAAGDVPLAEESRRRLAELAELTGSTLHRAHRDDAAGKIALATGQPGASPLLRSAALAFAEAGAPLPACRARLSLAQSLLPTDRGLAASEARGALLAFDRMGATAEADRAASLLRELGVRGRTGPRDVGALSRREQDVLRLVAEGLTNAEIADRLFISPKTAGNHVSNILAKLGLRSRTEAAAFALLNVPGRPAREQPRRPDDPRIQVRE